MPAHTCCLIQTSVPTCSVKNLQCQHTLAAWFRLLHLPLLWETSNASTHLLPDSGFCTYLFCEKPPMPAHTCCLTQASVPTCFVRNLQCQHTLAAWLSFCTYLFCEKPPMPAHTCCLTQASVPTCFVRNLQCQHTLAAWIRLLYLPVLWKTSNVSTHLLPDSDFCTYLFCEKPPMAAHVAAWLRLLYLPVLWEPSNASTHCPGLLPDSASVPTCSVRNLQCQHTLAVWLWLLYLPILWETSNASTHLLPDSGFCTYLFCEKPPMPAHTCCLTQASVPTCSVRNLQCQHTLAAWFRLLHLPLLWETSNASTHLLPDSGFCTYLFCEKPPMPAHTCCLTQTSVPTCSVRNLNASTHLLPDSDFWGPGKKRCKVIWNEEGRLWSLHALTECVD